LAETVNREADPAFGDVNFGKYLTTFGPEVGLGVYLEEITGTPQGVPKYFGKVDWLDQYIRGILS